MNWDGRWDTTLPKSDQLATINDWFVAKFPGYPSLCIQPSGKTSEEHYSYAEAVVRARELLNVGQSFSVWLHGFPFERITVTLKNDDDPGIQAKLPHTTPTPPSATNAVAVAQR